MASFRRVGFVKFPSPRGININMMPFVIGDAKSIPKEYHHYYPIIDQCNIDNKEHGKIGYLSIHESLVEKDNSQRRRGIHTEKTNLNGWGGGWGRGYKSWTSQHEKPYEGLFMASTINDSCRIWDTHIDKTGKHGDCENLREKLGPGELIKKNELIWLTDSCPHESLPLPETTFRQWFRFVTNKVDVWYKEHSTPNRLGVLPSCDIIHGSKFASG